MIKSQPTSHRALAHTKQAFAHRCQTFRNKDPQLSPGSCSPFRLCERSEPTESKMPFYTCVLRPACGAGGTPGLGTFPPSDTQQGPWLWMQTASPAANTISKSKSRNSDSCLFQALCHGAVSPLAWQQPEVFGKVGRSSDGERQ